MIRTKRLELRLAKARDAGAIVDYYRRNRRHLAPWEPQRPRKFFTEDHWRRQARANAREFRAGLGMRLFAFVDGRVIASVSVSNIQRGVFQACNLGYSLDGLEQGKGYMGEALEATLRYAFGELGLHRVMANYMPRNHRSARVLARLGFRIEGRAREYLRIAGRWEDHVLTSLVRPAARRRQRRR